MAKILIADDKKEISKVLDRILISKGHEIDVCGDGDAAINLYDGNEYDLIVTDILMPEKDGLEFAAHVRKSEEENNKKRTSILAITGGGSVVTTEMAHEAAKLYADEILLKPFNSENFIDTVERLLKA